MKHWPARSGNADYRSGVVMALQRCAFQAAERAGHLVTTRGRFATIVFCGQVRSIEYGRTEVIGYLHFERAVLDWAAATEQSFLREDTQSPRLSNSCLEAVRAILAEDWLAVPISLDDDQLLLILEKAAKIVSHDRESSKFA